MSAALPEAGSHAGFIYAAYAAAFLVFAGLTLRACLANSRAKRALRRLETVENRQQRL